MKHQTYKKGKKPSIFQRIWDYFHTDRWIVVVPRYTRKFPKPVKDIFDLRQGDRQ